MQFEKSYFEDEIRDGFYVPSDIKHAWAAQLEMLHDIDKVCRENGIEYFAEWGTLLGAVRHHGYIPWDDDMDICMKRPDYNRFLEIAEKAMPQGYKLFNISSDKDNDNMLTRILSRRAIDSDKDYLEKFNGFPFVVGIDIFPLDFIAPNKEDDDFQCQIIDIVNTFAKNLTDIFSSNKQLDEETIGIIEERIKQVEELCGVVIDRDKDIVQQFYVLLDKLFSLYTEDEAEYITIMALWADKRRYKLPKKYYEKSIRLPFENIDIPVPYAYDAILKTKYGDYMKLVHNWDSHNYPFYEKQVNLFKRKTGISLWGYYDNYEDYKVRKEKISKVRKLRFKQQANIDKLSDYKKTVVFMPYKASCWTAMESVWKEYKNSEEWNIKVVPIPYYYKNYDNTVEEYKDDYEYPDYVDITSCLEYDYTKENPDEIIIQNPYDEYNMAGTVHPNFYSLKLAMNTKKLIYIPYFMTEEINSLDMRAYISMNAYVTMPGVIYADEVRVQSENIRDLYVKKLTDFFGEESKLEWENKIKATGSPLEKAESIQVKLNKIPAEWRKKIVKEDGSYKKIMLYYIGANGFLEHGHSMLDKIERAMEIFKENEGNVMPLLAFEGDIYKILEGESKDLLEGYKELVGKYGDYIVSKKLVHTVIDVCDAYYGDACAAAQRCRNDGKPVMIQDVEI